MAKHRPTEYRFTFTGDPAIAMNARQQGKHLLRMLMQSADFQGLKQITRRRVEGDVIYTVTKNFNLWHLHIDAGGASKRAHDHGFYFNDNDPANVSGIWLIDYSAPGGLPASFYSANDYSNKYPNPFLSTPVPHWLGATDVLIANSTIVLRQGAEVWTLDLSPDPTPAAQGIGYTDDWGPYVLTRRQAEWDLYHQDAVTEEFVSGASLTLNDTWLAGRYGGFATTNFAGHDMLMYAFNENTYTLSVVHASALDPNAPVLEHEDLPASLGYNVSGVYSTTKTQDLESTRSCGAAWMEKFCYARPEFPINLGPWPVDENCIPANLPPWGNYTPVPDLWACPEAAPNVAAILTVFYGYVDTNTYTTVYVDPPNWTWYAAKFWVGSSEITAVCNVQASFESTDENIIDKDSAYSAWWFQSGWSSSLLGQTTTRTITQSSTVSWKVTLGKLVIPLFNYTGTKLVEIFSDNFNPGVDTQTITVDYSYFKAKWYLNAQKGYVHLMKYFDAGGITEEVHDIRTAEVVFSGSYASTPLDDGSAQNLVDSVTFDLGTMEIDVDGADVGETHSTRGTFPLTASIYDIEFQYSVDNKRMFQVRLKSTGVEVGSGLTDGTIDGTLNKTPAQPGTIIKDLAPF